MLELTDFDLHTHATVTFPGAEAEMSPQRSEQVRCADRKRRCHAMNRRLCSILLENRLFQILLDMFFLLPRDMLHRVR